jgi:hypothetical protein
VIRIFLGVITVLLVYTNININQLNDDVIDEYKILREKLLDHLKNYLTTEKIARYILQKTGFEKVTKILYLSSCLSPDYLRCLTLHGFKSIFGSNCHDYPKVPHMYKSHNIPISQLYGKGITYSGLLDQELHNDKFDTTIIEDITNKYYDIVIYGSYHRGMPYYDIISTIYKPNEIILLCGEDLHSCNCNYYIDRGNFVFVREL